MIKVAIYIQNSDTLLYDRVDLFDDEKISVTSSIQNINDITKTYTDYSQTFTIPASNVNNKIFKHWYENSRLESFSTLARANGRIDIDGFFFRSGKIQLEGCEMESGHPKSYSINFIGVLASLKDKFAGKYLKDLNTSAYDFLYTALNVMEAITSLTPSAEPPMPEIGFPLITSNNVWSYGNGNYNLGTNSHPIYYNELFPSVTLKAMMNMIGTTFGIGFSTDFIDDKKFKSAHLYLKNADTFSLLTGTQTKINLVSYSQVNSYTLGYSVNLTNDKVTNITANNGYGGYTFFEKYIQFKIKPTQTGKFYTVHFYKNGTQIYQSPTQTSTANVEVTFEIESDTGYPPIGTNDYFEVYVGTKEPMTFTSKIIGGIIYESETSYLDNTFTAVGTTQTTPATTCQLSNYMPDMKVEDFFTGILKMFNLTCYSNDNGANYILKQIDAYYNDGVDRDLTQYIKSDKKTINRVKTYKKINFEYEKSDSFVNQAFLTNAGFDYGSLYYSNIPVADGEEYSIKLPFENLNFQNLSGTFQVGYCLKTDYKAYIPKPIILYDYTPTALKTAPTWHFCTNTTGNATNSFTVYKAFGQEYKDTTVTPNITYGLNFNTQQSTLTNVIIQNGLYQMYYSNYFANIYSSKARIIKLSAVLPISILTSLKLNDNIFIRGDKFIINTVTFDMTTGETQFELLTDQRI